MTEQVAEEVPTTVSEVVSRLRDVTPDVDLERIRDTAVSALDTASSALSAVDVDAKRKAMNKRAKAAKKTAKSAAKSAKSAQVAAMAAGKTAAMQAKRSKAAIQHKPSLRERVFGWPLYSVAAAGAVLGSLAWWRGRQQRPAAATTPAATPATSTPPPPSEINVVDQADVEAQARRTNG